MFFYVVTYPAEPWYISFSSYIHYPWNTCSTQGNVQCANLEDKEVTQTLAIYWDQDTSSAAVTIHSWRNFSVTSGRSRDFHWGDSGVVGRKTESAERSKENILNRRRNISDQMQSMHHVANTVNIIVITNLSPKRKTRELKQSKTKKLSDERFL